MFARAVRLRRLLPAVAAAVLLVLGGRPAWTANREAEAGTRNLCARLFVPETYGLSCESDAGGAAVVAARDARFPALERLVLRELEPIGPDRLAWVRPQAWLRKRAEADFRALADLLAAFVRAELGEQKADALDAELDWLRRRLADLTAGMADRCRRRRAVASPVLDCRLGIEPFRLFYQLRLIAEGERRFAVEITALGRRRLRHFEAVANSFRPLS